MGADGKCVSRLRSMETWESGQPVTRAAKWAGRGIKPIYDGRFASSEFLHQYQTLETCPFASSSRFVWIMLRGFGLHPQNIFWSIRQNASCSKKKKKGCGLRLGSADMIASRPVTMEITTNDGSFQWSLSNSSYHQATVNQIAWHEDINQWGSAPRTPGSVKWVISLCTSATFCFLSLQSRESLWGALLGADWQTVQEALLPSALSAGGRFLSNVAPRL